MKEQRLNYLMAVLVIAGGVAWQAGCRSRSNEISSAPSPAPPETATPTPASAAQEAAPTPEATAPASSPAQPPARNATPTATPARSAMESERSNAPAPAAVEKPVPPPRSFTLSSGRVISVYSSSPISTKTHKTGDTFTGSLSKAIVDGDWVIANRGAPVEGVVTESDPGGRVKGVASIAVALKRLTLADGSTVEISTNPFSKQAPASRGRDAKRVGIGAGAGAVIGAIAGGGKGAAIGAGVGGGAGTAATMATRGDPAVIPDETLLTFRLNAPVTVRQR